MPGLRERKKQQTRQAIAGAAFDLFVERGFERVTVAEVARRADVSEATVYNYFRTKEDLVLGRLEAFESALVEAVRSRPPGRSIVAAFAGFLMAQQGLVAGLRPSDAERLRRVNRMIAESPALRARERQVYDDHVLQLTRFLAEEAGATPDDVRPWVVANALIGVHRALVDYVRANVLAGRVGPDLARRVRERAEEAFATLDAGLSTYP